MNHCLGAAADPVRRVLLKLAGAALLCAAPASASDLADFHRAVRLADAGAVETWLAAGGDPDAPDRDGRTALQVAVRYGHERIAVDLIASGADVNAQDGDGWTALHHAAAGDDPGLTARLLAAGAEVDHADPYRYTALHVAARGGHTEVVDRLLAAGADPSLAIDVGFTPADLASDRFPDLAQRLRAAAVR